MNNQKLKKDEINLNEKNSQKNEKQFLPYGGKPFSKKTGIKHFDAIIENGFNISSKSIWKNSLKNYTKIFWKTILFFVLVGIFQLILLAIVTIFNMSDLNVVFVYFLSNLAIMPVFTTSLYGNILKVLNEERFVNVRLKYLKMLGLASLLSVINVLLMFLVISSIVNINGIISDGDWGEININVINLLIFGILFIYFYVSYSFSIPLIIEYDYTIFESMQISRKIATRNFSSVFFNFIIYLLITISGLIIFRFGAILTIPMGLLYFCNLYLEIFKEDNVILEK